MNNDSQTTDPYRGVKIGDRYFHRIAGQSVVGTAWEEVTDLYFDPVRGQDNPKRGYMAAIRLMGIGRKYPVTIGRLTGKGFMHVGRAEAKADKVVADWMESLNVKA